MGVQRKPFFRQYQCKDQQLIWSLSFNNNGKNNVNSGTLCVISSSCDMLCKIRFIYDYNMMSASLTLFSTHTSSLPQSFSIVLSFYSLDALLLIVRQQRQPWISFVSSCSHSERRRSFMLALKRSQNKGASLFHCLYDIQYCLYVVQIVYVFISLRGIPWSPAIACYLTKSWHEVSSSNLFRSIIHMFLLPPRFRTN